MVNMQPPEIAGETGADGSNPAEIGRRPGAMALLARHGMPPRIASLPRDRRGYPVPYFVQWYDGDRPSRPGVGVPDFRVIDARASRTCEARNLCLVCGQALGRNLAFTIGPMCVVNRISPDPPSHLDCANYAARVCPFLAIPEARRPPMKREGVTWNEAGLPGNPGVAVVYVTRGYTLEKLPGDRLCRMGEPEAVTWWHRGEPATHDQVVAAFRAGLPALVDMALQEGPDAMRELRRLLYRAQKYTPAGRLPWDLVL